MGERSHCTMHQRYLNKDGECIDCQSLELVVICAKDIVDAWPSMTMRTIANMTKRIDTLRQALEAVKK